MQSKDAAEVPTDGVTHSPRNRQRARLWLAGITVAAAVVGSAGVALATAGSGATGMVIASGEFSDGLDVKFKVKDHHGTNVSQVKGPGKAIVQQLTVAPGGHTGWHSHDGPVVVVIKSGAVTLQSAHGDECTSQTYGPNQAFVDPGDGHVHIARNHGNEEAVLWVTFLLPADGAPRIDADAPAACAP